MPNTFSRRAFLIGGLTGLLLASCRSPSKTPIPESMLRNLPPVGYLKRFKTGYGGAHQLIERWPRNTEFEMAWAKEHGKVGQLIGIAKERSFGELTMGGDRLNIRSKIHTHIIKKNTPDDWKLTTHASLTDLKYFLGGRLFGKNARYKNVKFMHVAPITQEGKRVGYMTYFVGKKWVENEEKNRNKIEKIVFEIRDWEKFLETVGGIANIDGYAIGMAELVQKLKEYGLRVRAWPAPGYQYKDGYFQPK